MTFLYPRLSTTDALSIWEDVRELSVEALARRADNTHPKNYFAAVGGQRVKPVQLDAIALEIRSIAKKFGYPHKAKKSSLAEFDTEAAIFLATQIPMSHGEALRQETWAFVSLIMLPDIAKWRFPDFHQTRCTGGRRDCFQRLWLRANAFDLGENSSKRWIILSKLTEDAFVSILERPTLAGNPVICKVIGLSWIRKETETGRGVMEDINRKAIKQLRALSTLYLLDALDPSDLTKVVNECYKV